MPLEAPVMRLILVGDAGVGKTALLARFAGEPFVAECYAPTIMVDFVWRTADVGGGALRRLQCWDTAGQERFRSIISSYYRRSEGVALVYDVGDRVSFAQLRAYWAGIVECNVAPDAVRLVIANKCDLADGAAADAHAGLNNLGPRGAVRRVREAEGRLYAREIGALYAETSALTGEGVDTALLGLARAVHARQRARAAAEAVVNFTTAGFATAPLSTAHAHAHDRDRDRAVLDATDGKGAPRGCCR